MPYFERRKKQMHAQYGYHSAHLSWRAEIEAEIEQALADEFREEKS